uniref:Thioredoxin domain-containing protein 12 n=1 Tax=Cacopsylla melanoneura TaxID=428564 RepID=A0A8D8WTE5_9HEMI
MSMQSIGVILCAHICIIFLYPSVTFPVSAEQSYARGFGDHLKWQLLEDGLQAAKQSRKPILALFHKSWCGACRSLGPKVANSDKIAQLGEHFELINVYDDEEPRDPKYFPDGGYIPRILFLNADGEVDPTIYNERGSTEHKYFYYNAQTIVESMQHAMQMYHVDREL